MDRFVDLIRIGGGGFGEVFKAYDKTEQKHVAVKWIPFGNKDEGLPYQIIREASALKELNHANIIRLLDVDVAKTGYILVFEYMDSDLTKFIKERAKTGLDPLVIRGFLYQILEAVSHCHSLKILHRDLKPRNLLIDPERNIKLADFGFARPFDVPLPEYSTNVATLAYKAPELLLGLPYSFPIDIWAVGCIFAEMVMRKSLFSGISNSALMDQIISLFGLPDVSDWPEAASACSKLLFVEAVPRTRTRDLEGVVVGLDPEGLDLLKKMLCMNPHKRITAAHALEHPYLREVRSSQ